MPAKKQVTKEMILGAALRVLMEGGTEAVNVKSLAAELGCSTQPIYLSFDNMDALRKELIPTAVNKFVELMQKVRFNTGASVRHRVHLSCQAAAGTVPVLIHEVTGICRNETGAFAHN